MPLGRLWVYPLVNIQKTIENGHRNSGFTQEKCWIFPSFFVGLPQEKVIFHSFPIKHRDFPSVSH
jgi:hypothetical protein